MNECIIIRIVNKEIISTWIGEIPFLDRLSFLRELNSDKEFYKEYELFWEKTTLFIHFKDNEENLIYIFINPTKGFTEDILKIFEDKNK